MDDKPKVEVDETPAKIAAESLPAPVKPKKAKKRKKAKKHSGKIEITADEVQGLGMGAVRKGQRLDDLPKEVSDRLVKEGVAKRV
jgi:hypothetical protein